MRHELQWLNSDHATMVTRPIQCKQLRLWSHMLYTSAEALGPVTAPGTCRSFLLGLQWVLIRSQTEAANDTRLS